MRPPRPRALWTLSHLRIRRPCARSRSRSLPHRERKSASVTAAGYQPMLSRRYTNWAVEPVAYEVIAVRYGTVVSRRSALYLHWDTYAEPDGEERLDYFFYVL